MTASQEPAAVFEGVCKRYGANEVLHDIRLTIEKGECVVLVGHNGAGKTTLMKLILGLKRPSSGQLRVLGEDPARASAAQRGRIGYLPESVSLYRTLTGRETLQFYGRLRGTASEARDRLLERVGLVEAADRRISTYSKGMLQRLGLAQALLGQPEFLLFDEPTTGLDPALRADFYDLLQELRDAGTTALISSHSLSEIESRSDRIAILKNGRLVACGTLDELREAAELRVRIRVSVSPGRAPSVAASVGDAAALDKVNDHFVDLSCVTGDKMEVVRRLAGLGTPVEDIDIILPRLEEVYSYFSSKAGPQ